MADNLNERLAREFTAGQIDTERAPAAPTLFTPTEDMPSVVRSVKALKSAVDQLIGRNGSAFDKAVSLRDLVASGVLALKIGGTVIGSPLSTVGGGGGNVVIPAEPDGPGYRDPRPVLNVPPTLTEVQAHGAFRNIIVVWKRIDYRNHAHVEVWRSLTDNLGTATRLATTTANIYADATGQPDTTYYYWVRAVNIEGAIGAFNAVSGTAGTLAPLVDEEVPPQFIKRAMIALAAIDDALIANLSAAKITFGEMSGDRIAANTIHGDKITTNTLQGDRLLANSVTAGKIFGQNLIIWGGSHTSAYAWPAVGGGFHLSQSGLLIGNANQGKYFQVTEGGDVYAPNFSIVNGTATFSGTLSAAAGNFRGTVSSGVYNTLGWAWPAAGAGTGFYLGSEGLLIGNPNDNRWFMAATNGDISAPGFSVTGGVLTISQANVVNTLNIAGEAVLAPRTASSLTLQGVDNFGLSPDVLLTAPSITLNASSATTTMSVDFSASYGIASAYPTGTSGSITHPTFHIYRNGTQIWASSLLPGSAPPGMVRFAIHDTPGVGTWTYDLRMTAGDDALVTVYARVIQVLAVKR